MRSQSLNLGRRNDQPKRQKRLHVSCCVIFMVLVLLKVSGDIRFADAWEHTTCNMGNSIQHIRTAPDMLLEGFLLSQRYQIPKRQ